MSRTKTLGGVGEKGIDMLRNMMYQFKKGENKIMFGWESQITYSKEETIMAQQNGIVVVNNAELNVS